MCLIISGVNKEAKSNCVNTDTKTSNLIKNKGFIFFLGNRNGFFFCRYYACISAVKWPLIYF